MLSGLFQRSQSINVGGPIGSKADAVQMSSNPNYNSGYLAKRLGGHLRMADGTKLTLNSELEDKYDPTARITFPTMQHRLAYLTHATKDYEGEAEECLKSEFKDWLAGMHADNAEPRAYKNMPGRLRRRDTQGQLLEDWHPTWWGQGQLTHLPGVREYLRKDATFADKNEFDMNMLATFGPQNLEEAWAYFKYWVKRHPVGPEHCLSKTVPRDEPPPTHFLHIPGDVDKAIEKRDGELTSKKPIASSSSSIASSSSSIASSSSVVQNTKQALDQLDAQTQAQLNQLQQQLQQQQQQLQQYDQTMAQQKQASAAQLTQIAQYRQAIVDLQSQMGQVKVAYDQQTAQLLDQATAHAALLASFQNAQMIQQAQAPSTAQFALQLQAPQAPLQLQGPQAPLQLQGPPTALQLQGPQTALQLQAPQNALQLQAPPTALQLQGQAPPTPKSALMSFYPSNRPTKKGRGIVQVSYNQPKPMPKYRATTTQVPISTALAAVDNDTELTTHNDIEPTTGIAQDQLRHRGGKSGDDDDEDDKLIANPKRNVVPGLEDDNGDDEDLSGIDVHMTTEKDDDFIQMFDLSSNIDEDLGGLSFGMSSNKRQKTPDRMNFPLAIPVQVSPINLANARLIDDQRVGRLAHRLPDDKPQLLVSYQKFAKVPVQEKFELALRDDDLRRDTYLQSIALMESKGYLINAKNLAVSIQNEYGFTDKESRELAYTMMLYLYNTRPPDSPDKEDEFLRVWASFIEMEHEGYNNDLRALVNKVDSVNAKQLTKTTRELGNRGTAVSTTVSEEGLIKKIAKISINTRGRDAAIEEFIELRAQAPDQAGQMKIQKILVALASDGRTTSYDELNLQERHLIRIR